jgi:hypothetical protein
MDLIHRKAHQSALFFHVHASLPTVKLVNYALVVALNINILLSRSYNQNPTHVILDYIKNEKGMSLAFASVLVTTALGGLVTLGFALIIFTRSVTEIPLVIQAIDQEVKLAAKHPGTKSFFTLWGSNIFALIGTSCFIALHYLNFKVNYIIYATLFLTFNVPLILRTLRDSIFDCQKPITPFRRKYAIIYDASLRRSFLRNHIVLILFCLLVSFLDIYL